MRTRMRRLYFRRFLQPINRMDLSPGTVARTCAVGGAAGISATVGLQTIGVFILWVCTRRFEAHRFNLAIALLLTGITNPLTVVPMYGFYYTCGNWMLGRTTSLVDVSTIIDRIKDEGLWAVVAGSWQFFAVSLVGSLPFTIIGTIALYSTGRWIGQKLEARRRIRKRRRERLKLGDLAKKLTLRRRNDGA